MRLTPLAATPLVLVFLAFFEACSGEPPKKEPKVCNMPALFEKCAGSVCHAGDEPAGELDLESAGVDGRLFGVTSSESCGKKILVEPGYPELSLLFEKLTSKDPSCGRAMPPTGFLPDEDIACFKKYIEDATGGPSCETCGGILCVELASDENHCGTCATTCESGKTCESGVCVDPCVPGETFCGSECVDLTSDQRNCGECGHRCGPNSTCSAGICACEPDVTASFSLDIQPIFKASCGGADCHTGADALSDLRLDAKNAYAQLVGATSDGCGGRTRVVPSNPDESYLLDKLLGGRICNGKRMPIFDDPLPEEAIGKVVAWICDGAKEN